MGRLATMLGDIQAAKTPLERRVDQLGRQIARWVLALAAVLGLLGIVAEGLGRAPEMIIFAVALAVAAVPEGLPAVLTVALALGVERMARHRAVVRRLSAVEALGFGDRHCDRQDRHVDREPHGRADARCARSAARACGHRAGQRCGPDDRRRRSARSRPAALCRGARRGRRAAAAERPLARPSGRSTAPGSSPASRYERTGDR